ncbi:hypothetical protein [Mucilaginibacter gilvus]|uniref:Uncharacterized protein n=1 Tax=Mucilaginibacter gilvus TaxID=2305909 RepID=A0A3S3VLU7_9SPHI|nr:hypothetical protein [Mucilaginibacter gilvus]RWY51127.1 hypothetical protein EPL05_13760 [Mucilaginibacter gilvus]
MYWYKPFSKYILFTGGLLLLCTWYACKPEIKETGATLKYFDLKEFFKTDSVHLVKLNPNIKKTVTHNGESETKTVKIANWGQEFGLFTSSDINKPAWKDSYAVTENTDSLMYKAKFPELKTREIVIHKNNGKVTRLYILNNIHNLLYTTTEKLLYVPGEYYLIEKDQKVKVMSGNNYLIKGEF